MGLLKDHSELFRQKIIEMVDSMFGQSLDPIGEIVELGQFENEKKLNLCVLFTGTVYGEYFLSLDFETAFSLLELEEGDADAEEECVEAFKELMNLAVGKCLNQLEKSYPNLTYTSPRVVVGKMSYPPIPTGRGKLKGEAGELDCHFYVDLMKLDLAVSYDDAVDKLKESKAKLEVALDSLKNNQAQLVHSEKMASLGTLAAGVAHEINNPTGFVISNIETLEGYIGVIKTLMSIYEDLSQSIAGKKQEDLEAFKKREDIDFIISDATDIITESKDGLTRIKDIVLDLKTYARPDEEDFIEADLNECLKSTLRLASNEIKYKCEVVEKFNEINPILCIPGQLNQVFTNLLVNAAQAIEKKGKISISTEELDTYVKIVISDNGVGIPKEKMDKIFNPFYTTKPIGEGTGLGLSISLKIIEKHKGKICAESEIGKGTDFIIYLPHNPHKDILEKKGVNG